jgi:hypothetical protein
MGFWRRFRFFAIGLGLGTIISVILFQGRGCSWLPENRVLDRIAANTIVADARIVCLLSCNNLEINEIIRVLKNGDLEVYFKESDTESDPKVYRLKGELKGDVSIELDIALRDTLMEIVGFETGSEKCECSEKNEGIRVLWLPESQLKQGLAKRKPFYLPDVEKQMKIAGLTGSEFVRLLEEGKIDYASSLPYQGANPIWVIQGMSSGKNLSLKVEMTEDKVVLLDVNEVVTK